MNSVNLFAHVVLQGHLHVQCRSEISEPKCARKTSTIRVFVYTHTSIDKYAYAYKLIRVCLISMYELGYCFSIVERSLLISMGIAIAVKTGGQAACLSIFLCLFRLFVS